MLTLLNGKHIDEDMVELAMEDSNMGNAIFLNINRYPEKPG